MAVWNDPTLDLKRGPISRSVGLDRANDILDEGVQRYGAGVDRTSAAIDSTISQPATTGSDEFTPAEFAMNAKTGEIALPNGQVVKITAPVILQLATLKNEDGSPIPVMSADTLKRLQEKGFRPYSHQKLVTDTEAVPTESDFWGSAMASGKTTLGLIASAMDAMVGNDDPSNAWSRAQQEHENDQSIGQLKASRGRWYTGIDSFLNALGETAGNVGGTAVGAVPGMVAGAVAGGAPTGGAGALPGAITGAGLAATGGLAAFGEQATDFYDSAIEAMQKMSPGELERESPLYRKVVSENPNMDHDEAVRQVAIEGARAAGSTASLLGAAEAMVGGKLAGNMLARMGVRKAILGEAASAARRGGVGRTIARVGGRTVAGGGAAGAEEMLETMLGQSAGAQVTGIGSKDPMDYANVEEGIQAALGGGIFGAFGGSHSRANIENSDIAAALSIDGTPEVNRAEVLRVERTQEQDLLPPSLRGLGQTGERVRGMALQRESQLIQNGEEYAQVAQQLEGMISQRLGTEQWTPDQAASRPETRQLLGQLIALEQQAREQGMSPAYERGYGQGPVQALPPPQAQDQVPVDLPPGEAPTNLQGPAFGDQPRGLAQRRQEQMAAQEQARIASEQNPAALEAPPSRAIEQEIFDIEDQLDEARSVFQQRGGNRGRSMQNRAMAAEIQRLEAALADAEQRWQQAKEGEATGVAPGNAVAPQVDAPEPVAASQERTPDGRPMGVAPAPLVNPEPMSPEEAASRAQTQQDRAQAAGVEAPVVASPEAVAAAAAQSEQQVSPSTPEPAEDIAAQLQAMADPESARDAVFVAAGNEAQIPSQLPPGAKRVTRQGVGTLITTNAKKANDFRLKRMTDDSIAKLVGYSEPKAKALRRGKGEAPAVVQATTPTGAVAAEQVASKKGLKAAKKAVKRLAPKGAKVEVTTPEKAQARRSLAKPKETPTPAKKTLKRKAKDEDERPGRKDNDDITRADRALARAEKPAQAPALPAADQVERSTTRKPEEVRGNDNKRIKLPERLTTLTGRKGAEVDLRVQAIDEDARYLVGQAMDGHTLNAADRAKVEAAAAAFDQMDTMLDAAVSAAEDKLRTVVTESPDGAAFEREAAKRQLELEHTAKSGERGRPRERPKTSPIAYLPLVVSEARGFLKAMRAEAKAELQSGYFPATSTARQMITAITPALDNVLENELQGKRILQVIANQTDAQLEATLQSTYQRIQDSTVAKQVMRGATEVAHAIRRAENDLVGSRVPDMADHENQNKQPHATELGDLPEGARGLVNDWVRAFEKAGNKFSAPVTVMSVKDAMKYFPGAFANGRIPNGKYIRKTDANNKTVGHILAVDWGRFKFEGAAIEVLAHEYGHMVTTELYARTDPRTRRAIDRAYDQWLRLQQGRSVDDILRDHMPGIERAVFQGGATNRAYAESFHEWAARNATLYLLDPARPHIGAVEKFFKSIADVMRAIYAAITGSPKPDAAWAEALDRWVNGTMVLSQMPNVPGANFDHAEFEDAKEEPARAGTNLIARTATNALAPLRKAIAGEATMADVRDTMRPLVDSEAGVGLQKLGLSLMTMRQIERKYRDTPLGPALSGWVRNQQLKAKTAKATMEEGSKWMELANQLDARVRNTLEKVMYQSTHFKVHPELPITDKANAHLLRGSKDVVDVQQKRYTGVADLYNAMVKADPKTAEIYAGLRDAFTSLHEKTLEKMIENVSTANFSDKAKDQIIKRIKSQQAEMREGPYFPLMRFGDWRVTVQLPAFYVGQNGKEGGEFFDTKQAARDEMRNQRALNPGAAVRVERTPEGKYLVRVFQKGVYFFESPAAADAARADIEAEVREHYLANNVDFDEAQEAMPEGEDGEKQPIISNVKGNRDDYADTRRASPEFMQEVRTLIADNKLDPEVGAVLERLAIEALPENNYRQSLLPRQNVFGASKQMLRAYAHRYQGAAHHYSAVEHGAQINKNWAKAWEQNEKFKPTATVLNSLKANQNAIAERMKDTVGNRIMNTITEASSLYSLGFSPAYALTNSLQPWTVALPTIAGLTTPGGQSIGMGKAARYMREAYEGALPFFTKRGFSDFINETKGLLGKKGNEQTLQQTAEDIVERFGKTGGEKKMLKSLLERGTLDFSWLSSLEDAMASGTASQKWANLQRMGMAFPQQVEAMNRVTTALAAYRLAKDERIVDPNDETLLQQFADDMVADTQLDYSRMNRPLAFNKAGLNVILQFKLYMQGMYALFARNAAMALRGKTPEERKQGRRTFAYLMATHAAAAGAAGLGPAAFMAKMALVAFAAMTPDDDDDWKSGEQLLRDMLKDTFGEYGGTVAEKGLPAILGVDMSDRIGIPVLADTRFANIKESDTAGQSMDKWVIYGLGAPYSNAKRALQGASDAANGDFSSAVNGLPAAARSVARSMKWAREGIVDKDGDTFVPPSELGWGDLAINTLGLSPLSTSRAYSERTELKQTTGRIINERRRLMQAARTGEDVSDEIREFNASAPRPFRISAEQISKAKEAKRGREGGDLRKDEAAVKKLLGQ